MAYDSSVAFDGVVVIESLRKPARLTGTDLFETTIAPDAFAKNAFAELFHVSTRSEFFAALSRAQELADHNHSPIIHFEMHGDESGLQLTSMEMIPWSELAPLLTRINERTRVNLLVVAAACHGWHLSEVLRPVDRAPAWGIIGPPDSVRDLDLYEAMQRFYATLWRSVNLRQALDAANGTSDMSAWTYRVQSADFLYCRIFQWYVASLRDKTEAERVNRLVAELARAQNLDVMETMRLRQDIARDLNNHQFWFDRFKTRFLMLDLFPENARRFKIELSDCLPPAV
jgi:hypothetical protein